MAKSSLVSVGMPNPDWFKIPSTEIFYFHLKSYGGFFQLNHNPTSNCQLQMACNFQGLLGQLYFWIRHLYPNLPVNKYDSLENICQDANVPIEPVLTTFREELAFLFQQRIIELPNVRSHFSYKPLMILDVTDHVDNKYHLPRVFEGFIHTRLPYKSTNNHNMVMYFILIQDFVTKYAKN